MGVATTQRVTVRRRQQQTIPMILHQWVLNLTPLRRLNIKKVMQLEIQMGIPLTILTMKLIRVNGKNF